jgi:hypothetical protein
MRCALGFGVIQKPRQALLTENPLACIRKTSMP